jgi:hypothetical protein
MTEWTLSDIKIGLPKWPELVVVGERVTKEQAAEILIRTDGLDFRYCCNDKDWERQLIEAVGLTDCTGTIETFKQDWEALAATERRYGVLPLNYLGNSQIASAYIGGPHGWCDWAGNIGTAGYNIGKWPSYEDVYEDWQKIAEAFPFLKLKSQLFNGEQVEDNTSPTVEFHVADGQVKIYEPGPRLNWPAVDQTAKFIREYNMVGRERGCTIDQFKWALTLAEKAASKVSTVTTTTV